jgi:hypothetical protein
LTEFVASVTPLDSPADTEPVKADATAAVLAVLYAATILVSAFLLFQVQPLISKYILPWFGGSPAVWTTAMLSFQTLLFGGYAYAHFAQRWLPAGGQALFHLGVLTACMALLPIAPSTSWKPDDASDPTWRIVALLAATVGLPYFLLSTTGPLVQAWFARAYPGRSPYRLYALSNAGSLAALVSYPFLVEPLLRVTTQAWVWSAGFVGFALLAGVAAVANWRMARRAVTDGSLSGVPPALPVSGEHGETSARVSSSTNELAAGGSLLYGAGAPSVGRRAAWLALPAFASTALLATTNHVCQDVAVIPFLWVVPLSLYLLTFIITFDHERWYLRSWAAPALMLLSLAVAALNDPPFSAGFVGELLIYFGAMFVLCLVCHGELVRLKPAAENLTAFYLCISAGGALGGMFVSLLAPVLFKTYWEWKLVVVGGYALGAWLALSELSRSSSTSAVGRPTPIFAILAGVSILAGFAAIVRYEDYMSDTVLATPMSRLYNDGYRCETKAVERNFYGVVTVLERFGPDPRHHDFVMFNGQIPHGVQLAENELRREAISYYSEPTGVVRAFRFYQQRPNMRSGVIGLGVGTLANLVRPGDHMTYYEINPEVEKLARQFFTNLSDCRGTVDVSLGDGRLCLERSESQQFDLLTLDAFSGDAIPSHLLTKEAFEIYERQMKPDGALVVHISNKYLKLLPVVRGLAQQGHYRLARVLTYGDDDQIYRADFAVLTRNAELIEAMRSEAEVEDYSALGAEAMSPPPGADRPWSVLWTDDHNDLFEILR